MQSVCDVIRDAETSYNQGNTQISKYVSWSLKDTIDTVDAYLNSKHLSGEVDSLGREKPFFNIVTAAVNVWYRATDLDRKDLKYIPTKSSSTVVAFVANVLLQNWMMKYNFGVFLNQWGRSLARYGSSVVKFVEKGDELIATVVPWNRLIVDSVDFEALPRIEKFYKTAAQLRQMKEYDQGVVDALINAKQSRENLDGNQKDDRNEFIELYEVHGLMDERLLDDDPDISLEDKDIKYVQQMHVVSYVQDKEGHYEDFCLYKGREAQDPYMITHLIEEDGRVLAIGAVEHLFEAQWQANHAIKNMKDTLDLASKLIFQTADKRYVGRNVLSAIETGDIFIHEPNMPLTRVANDKPDVTAQQNYGTMWRELGQEISSTPDAARGVTPPSGTALGTVQIVTAQGLSLFEIMVENKGLALEEMCRRFINPHLRKQLKNKKEIVGLLDDAGIAEIDAIYVPREAVKKFNERVVDDLFAQIDNPDAPIPTPFQKDAEETKVRQGLGALGNKRFFVPDELSQKQWDSIFSDFEWDSLRVEVTNEQQDKRAVYQTLTTVLQLVGNAANAGRPLSPDERMILNTILKETAILSPIQLSATGASVPTSPNAGEEISKLGNNNGEITPTA